MAKQKVIKQTENNHIHIGIFPSEIKTNKKIIQTVKNKIENETKI